MKILKGLAWFIVPYIMIFFRWNKLSKAGRAGAVLWTVVVLFIAIPANIENQNTATKEEVNKTNVAEIKQETKTPEAVAAVTTETKEAETIDKAAEEAAKKKEEAAKKKEAEEKAKADKERNQTAVKDFEKALYSLEDEMKPIMANYQTAMDGMANGTIDIFTVYGAAEDAKSASRYLQSEVRKVDIPEYLPEEVQDYLVEARSDLSTAYFSKGEAFDLVLEFLDEQKPSYMSKIEDEIKMSDSFLLSGMAKVMQAKDAVGIDITVE